MFVMLIKLATILKSRWTETVRDKQNTSGMRKPKIITREKSFDSNAAITCCAASPLPAVYDFSLAKVNDTSQLRHYSWIFYRQLTKVEDDFLLFRF